MVLGRRRLGRASEPATRLKPDRASGEERRKPGGPHLLSRCTTGSACVAWRPSGTTRWPSASSRSPRGTSSAPPRLRLPRHRRRIRGRLKDALSQVYFSVSNLRNVPLYSALAYGALHARDGVDSLRPCALQTYRATPSSCASAMWASRHLPRACGMTEAKEIKSRRLCTLTAPPTRRPRASLPRRRRARRAHSPHGLVGPGRCCLSGTLGYRVVHFGRSDHLAKLAGYTVYA